MTELHEHYKNNQIEQTAWNKRLTSFIRRHDWNLSRFSLRQSASIFDFKYRRQASSRRKPRRLQSFVGRITSG